MPSDEINFTNGAVMLPGGSPLTPDAGYAFGKFITDSPYPDPNDPTRTLRDLAVEFPVTALPFQIEVNGAGVSIDYIITFNSYLDVNGVQLWP